MNCGECGAEFNQNLSSATCKPCNFNLCSYDCSMKHQERTGHYLTHLATRDV